MISEGTVGTCRVFEQLVLRGHVTVVERSARFEFALYSLFIGAILWAVVDVSARCAEFAVTALTFEKSAKPSTSRVMVGLEAQERADGFRPAASYILERQPVLDISAPVLAERMDAAEDHAPPSKAKYNTLPYGPRVAGWLMRVKMKTAKNADDESSGRLILRSLRTEMN